MSIVSQFALFSHSPFPLLPAPKIAGLLPANVPKPPEVTILRPGEDDPPVYEFPTPEEIDLDIYMTFLRIAQRAAAVML
jgi:hypothetical protein